MLKFNHLDKNIRINQQNTLCIIYIYQIINLKVIVGAFQNLMVGYPTYVWCEQGHTLFYIYSAENDHEQL